jgi:putative membrane protein
MQFLKALFWFLIMGLAAAFAVTNWRPVEIQLWSGLVADVNLPFLIALAFLLGLLPMMLIYQAVRWRLRQRIAMLERTVEDLRVVNSVAATPLPLPDSGEAPSAPPLVTA